MSGYKWRDGEEGEECGHRGKIWHPPNTEVAKVPCPYCKAKAGAVCTKGQLRRRVEPHAVRYIEHHSEFCGRGPDWAEPTPDPARTQEAAASAAAKGTEVAG